MNDGLIVIDKPAGMTSHDVVGRCRSIVGQRRIGHSGTLDPGATGVLLVALGRVTRLIRFLSDLPKSYTCEVVLGTATSTLDDGGEVIATWNMSRIELLDVRAASEQFVGDIMQVPPMVSALKVDGKRLYELARQGIEIELKARPVTVHSLQIDATDQAGVFALSMSCSSGTYVRSLVADIGAALGGGAHLRKLRRTAIGSFDESSAVTLDALENDGWTPYSVGAGDVLAHLPRIVADAAVADDVAHGRKIDRSAVDVEGDGPWAVVDTGGTLLGVYELLDEMRLKAGVVIASR